jgi:hypothetical protein
MSHATVQDKVQNVAGRCLPAVAWVVLTTAVPPAAATDVPQTRVTVGALRVGTVGPRHFIDGSDQAVYPTGSHTWAKMRISCREVDARVGATATTAGQNMPYSWANTIEL